MPVFPGFLEIIRVVIFKRNAKSAAHHRGFCNKKRGEEKMKKMKVGSKFIYCPMCLAAGLTLS